MIISKNHDLLNDILAFREFGIPFDLNLMSNIEENDPFF